MYSEKDIDGKFEQQDKDIKLYVDMKIRAVKKMLAFWIWIGKNPKVSVFIFVLSIAIGIWVAHKIDVRHTLENSTGVRFNVEESNKVSNKD